MEEVHTSLKGLCDNTLMDSLILSPTSLVFLSKVWRLLTKPSAIAKPRRPIPPYLSPPTYGLRPSLPHQSRNLPHSYQGGLNTLLVTLSYLSNSTRSISLAPTLTHSPTLAHFRTFTYVPFVRGLFVPTRQECTRPFFIVCSNDTLSVGYSVFQCHHEASIDPPRPSLRSSLGKNGWMAQHGHMDGWLDCFWMQCAFILSTCNPPWDGWERTPHVPPPRPPKPPPKKKKNEKRRPSPLFRFFFFFSRVDLSGDVFHRPLRLEFTSMLSSVGASAATPFRRLRRRLRRALVPIRRFHAPHTCKTLRSDPKEGVGRRGGTHPWRSRTRETHGGRDVLPPTPRKKRTWS